MKKILYVTPHLSTGGLPQYLCKKIECFDKEFDIWCIEHSNYSDEYVVQKNKIRDILKDKLKTLGHDKSEILSIIKDINPDVIHFEEIPETFLSAEILDSIYNNERGYNIVVTTHSSETNPKNLRYLADKFILVSEWSLGVFKSVLGDSIPLEIWEYPIEIKTNIDRDFYKKKLGLDKDFIHILNVGLFTPGKNQGEIFNLAKSLLNYKVKFHFVGNLAGNFENYWLPILQSKPENCIIHGERSDVEDFYSACDAFYFSSNFELNPLVIKEAISFGLPVFAKKLHTYSNTYDGKVNYINGDVQNDISILFNFLNITKKVKAYHLLVDVNSDREILSIDSMSRISSKIEYNQCINKKYVGEDWKKLTPITGWANHGPGHWGAFTSFRKAILENFTDDLFGILLFEADCVLDVEVDEFVQLVNRASEFCKKHKLPLFSFGPRFLNGVDQSPIVEEDDEFSDFVITSRFIQAHCILITEYMKDYLFTQLRENWDSPDIFFNAIYQRIDQKIGIMREPISHQECGMSMIDNIEKGELTRRTFDYVEIGTSNFDTLLEVLGDDKRGISIEPIDYYLEDLPNKPNNIKLNAAISDTTKKTKIFLVDKEDIHAHNLPEWIKGCNSIDEPHRSVVNYLESSNLTHLYRNYEIDTLSFVDFCNRYDINAIKYLKIDTEGHDFTILRNVIESDVRPRKIRFEANSLYNETDIVDIIQFLSNNNYNLIQRTFDDIVVRYKDDRYDYQPDNKPVLIISTCRRLEYFKRTIDSLFEKNKNINQLFKKVWLFDDRSSSSDRAEMDIIMNKYFGDNYSSVNFNNNGKYDFIDKFNFIKRVTEIDDIIFFLEDDWVCHDELHLNFHLYNLINSDYTQISFCDPLEIQSPEIIDNNLIDLDYWKNPFPGIFKHPFKWNGDICYWSTVAMNNYTNNPSIIKAEVFHNSEFKKIKNFEGDFADSNNFKLIYTQECLFRHIGDESLINKL
jgi:glycosyltransferase involved in cell wall biosynthesis